VIPTTTICHPERSEGSAFAFRCVSRHRAVGRGFNPDIEAHAAFLTIKERDEVALLIRRTNIKLSS
jgi:hypothetical protein